VLGGGVLGGGVLGGGVGSGVVPVLGSVLGSTGFAVDAGSPRSSVFLSHAAANSSATTPHKKIFMTLSSWCPC
jgi:hypothetical protein